MPCMHLFVIWVRMQFQCLQWKFLKGTSLLWKRRHTSEQSADIYFLCNIWFSHSGVSCAVFGQCEIVYVTFMPTMARFFEKGWEDCGRMSRQDGSVNWVYRSCKQSGSSVVSEMQTKSVVKNVYSELLKAVVERQSQDLCEKRCVTAHSVDAFCRLVSWLWGYQYMCT
jgi:hypothetical protein